MSRGPSHSSLTVILPPGPARGSADVFCAGSESDDSIAYTSNRGRKLKRKARYVHEGALNDAKGPRVYKEVRRLAGKAEFG
jgi:RXT2-like, N-terminal